MMHSARATEQIGENALRSCRIIDDVFKYQTSLMWSARIRQRGLSGLVFLLFEFEKSEERKVQFVLREKIKEISQYVYSMVIYSSFTLLVSSYLIYTICDVT